MQPDPAPPRKQLSPGVRGLLVLCGFIAVGLGILGIFLPVLPTVPFLLLAAARFTRSSEKFYTWLIDHAHLGPIVRPYLDGKGLKKSTKTKAIGLIWISIIISIQFLTGKIWAQVLLIVIALCISLYLAYLPSLESDLPREE